MRVRTIDKSSKRKFSRRRCSELICDRMALTSHSMLQICHSNHRLGVDTLPMGRIVSGVGVRNVMQTLIGGSSSRPINAFRPYSFEDASRVLLSSQEPHLDVRRKHS
jgi:hypothetical protein